MGHSAGGGYLLDYALEHPESIQVAVFDCPSWDCDATDRYRLPVAASLLEAADKSEAARICRKAAQSPQRLMFDPQVLSAMQELGPDYLRLFTYDENGLATYLELASQAPTDLDWAKGVSHLPLVGDLYRDRTPRLAQLVCRSYLFVGSKDLVCPPAIIDAFRSQVDGGEVVSFERSGHFSYIEQPDEYADRLAEAVRPVG